MKKLAAIAIFAIIFAAGPAFGDGVNIGASGTGATIFDFGNVAGAAATGDTAYETLAAQFTVTGTSEINQVSLGVQDVGNTGLPYGVAIVNGLTGGTTFWSATLTGSDPTVALSLTLDPGTYYLLGPTNTLDGPGADFGWNESNNVLSQIGGTVGDGVWADGIFDGIDLGWQQVAGDPLQFDIANVPPTTPTPEPASLLLFGTGILGLGMLMRRKRPTAVAARH